MKILEIEVYEKHELGPSGAQARYLVRSHDDLLWTDDINSALEFLRASLENLVSSVSHTTGG